MPDARSTEVPARSTRSARPARSVIDRSGLDALIGELRRRGHDVLGPTREGGAIVYGPIESVGDLPAGWTDEQEAGRYRLRRRDDDALFAYAVGPQSPKHELFPPRTLLWRGTRTDDGFLVEEPEPDHTPRALLGVRGCELAAIAVQDRVFAQGPHADPQYVARRERLFVVAVHCTTPAATCFCTSMGTGPRVGDGAGSGAEPGPGAGSGYDLALTELLGDPDGRLLVEVGTERGAEVLASIPTLPTDEASLEDVTARADALIEAAADAMGRRLDTTDLRGLLATTLEHPRWDDVAERCLSCANCTMVCPTCFCSTVEDVTDLTGDHAERWRRWDSCFTLDHSFLHEGSVRSTGRARYRQWLTHKLGTWWDQFDTSGCVGCGRCITWCPVGIDLTEEIPALRAPPTDATGHESAGGGGRDRDQNASVEGSDG